MVAEDAELLLCAMGLVGSPDICPFRGFAVQPLCLSLLNTKQDV